MPPKKPAGKPGRPPKAQPMPEPKVPQSSPMTQTVMDAMAAFAEKLQEFAHETLADLETLHTDFDKLYHSMSGKNGAALAANVSSRDPEPEPALDFASMDVDDLQDVIEKYGLDVKLTGIRGMAAKQAAVEEEYLNHREPQGLNLQEAKTLDVSDMGVAELQAVIDRCNLDVHLASIKGLAAKQAAVEKAWASEAYASDSESATSDAPDFTEMTKKELQVYIDTYVLAVSLTDYLTLGEMQDAVEEAYTLYERDGIPGPAGDDDNNGWPEN